MKKILNICLICLCTFASLISEAHPESTLLQPEEINETITNIVSEIEQSYLSTEYVKPLSQALQSKLTLARYQKAYDTLQFARDIRALMVEITNDKNIDLTYKKSAAIQTMSSLPVQISPAIKSSVLAGNIGHLKITGNLTQADANTMIDNAMARLKNCDALIIDLRTAEITTLTNTVHLLSYFLPTNTYLGTLQLNNHTVKLKSTNTKAVNKLKNNFPLYVINSAFVEGHWELFSHTLKSLNKALIVGEDTMGQEAFTKLISVSDKLSLRIPYATITLPNSNADWQHGVTADDYQKSDKAFDHAYQLARQFLESVVN